MARCYENFSKAFHSLSLSFSFSLHYISVPINKIDHYLQTKKFNFQYYLLLDAPEVTIRQGDSTTVRENTDLILNCAVDAKPAASVKWYRGKAHISHI